ncbi:MAG: YgiQ family radical SAM protein [Eubacteriales bacterium]
MNHGFLPTTKYEMTEQGIDALDFIIVSADAYIDHHSFAAALLGRWLSTFGYTVGIIAQPDFHNAESFKRLGRPKYAFLVSTGNIDSMVNLYTANKRPRRTDAYTPGGETGKRPKRAGIVYTNRLKEAYKDVPVIIGGIEPSLRRFAHYDYWDDKVRQSLLVDSGADLLVYGMGEKPLLALAECFESGMYIKDMTFIAGTCYMAKDISSVYDGIEIPSFESVSTDKSAYNEAFKTQYRNLEFGHAKTLVQKHGEKYLVQNPPSEPLSTDDMDTLYALPFTGKPHFSYNQPIPAFEEVKFSITANRGCIGGCAFCAIQYHQGRSISKRSKESILDEAKKMTDDNDFKGYIHDVGGPTANFYDAYCKRDKSKPCYRLCLYPDKCKNLNVSHIEYLDVLRDMRKLPKIKKVFIRSGLRFDYMVYDKKSGFVEELAKHHVSGQLRTAPEHIDCDVLKLMNKPDNALYEEFLDAFFKANQKTGKEQYVIPYFIASHPGSTLQSAINLALYLKKTGFIPEQVQDFYPTPGTLSTCMYYTGVNPLTKEKVYVPKSESERQMQRALLQFNRSKNRKWVLAALKKAGREDLIGKGKHFLIND